MIYNHRCRVCPKFVSRGKKFCSPKCATKFYASGALKEKRQRLAANARRNLSAATKAYFARLCSKEERFFWKERRCSKCGASGKRMHVILKKPFWQGGQYTPDNIRYYCSNCNKCSV